MISGRCQGLGRGLEVEEHRCLLSLFMVPILLEINQIYQKICRSSNRDRWRVDELECFFIFVCQRKRKVCVFGLIIGKEKMNGISNGFGSAGAMAATEFVKRHHRHQTGEDQCSSAVVKRIKAPVPLVTLFLVDYVFIFVVFIYNSSFSIIGIAISFSFLSDCHCDFDLLRIFIFACLPSDMYTYFNVRFAFC